MGKFNPNSWFTVDTETNGVYYWLGHQPFAVSMCDDNGNTYYTQWRVDPKTRIVQPDERDVRYLRKVLSSRKPKWFHNLKFDKRQLHNVGIEVSGPVGDCLISGRICNTLEPSYALKYLAHKYGGIPKDDEDELQRATVRGRNKAKKLGWTIATEATHGKGYTNADYWIPHQLDPNDNHCEEYARLDAVRTLIIGGLYQRLMDQDSVLLKQYEKEMELFDIVYEMETRGVRIDREIVQREQRAFQEKADRLLIEIRKEVKDPNFNPNSTQQVVKYLHSPKKKKGGGLGLPVIKRTEKGNPSTEWEALAPYTGIPFVHNFLSRKASLKANNTFFDKYMFFMVPDHISEEEWCLHCEYSTTGAKTLRLSCKMPNLTQVGNSDTASKSYEPVQAREGFGPRKGYFWYTPDFAQQEVRIFADVADIEEMITPIIEGRDINTENANRAWGGKGNPYASQAAAYALELGSVDKSRVKPEVLAVWSDIGWSEKKAHLGATSVQALDIGEQWLRAFNYDIVEAEKSIGKKATRTRAKNIIFAKIYGGGATAVMDMLYCSEKEAKMFMDQFDDIFPGIREFANRTIRFVKEHGCIYTAYGNRLHVDRNFAYKGTNYIIQGTAAQMMKSAMIRCHKYLKKTGLDAHMVLTVHDELVFEIRKEHAYKWLLRGIKSRMEDTSGSTLRVPMEVEINRVVKSWNKKQTVRL